MPDPAQAVLVVGSLHHDIMIEADHLPRRDETAIGSRWYAKFGGKGGNQAVAARRAGVIVRMFGAVGQDGFGQFLTGALEAAGVDPAHVQQPPGVATGMSVAITDAGGDYAATIVSGANLAIDPGGLGQDALWSSVAMLVLQNEIPEAVNLAAATEARRRGIPVLLNAAPARALPDALSGLVDILVVNAVEAEMMGAAPVTTLGSAALAARTLGPGFDTVIVTAGGAGLAAWTAQGDQVVLPAEKVSVVSTHGAGDMFVGTLAAALARRLPFPDACAMASHAAALHVAAAV